jgi:hypothetical protein
MPPRNTKKIALTISRIDHSRFRPHPNSPGSIGSRIAHSAPVTSLPFCSPARLCCAWVVGVHIEMLVQGVAIRMNHGSPRPSSPSADHADGVSNSLLEWYLVIKIAAPGIWLRRH